MVWHVGADAAPEQESARGPSRKETHGDRRGQLDRQPRRRCARRDRRRREFALHREPAFQEGPGLRCAGGFAASDHAAETSLALPLFHAMTEGEQTEVVEVLARETSG